MKGMTTVSLLLQYFVSPLITVALAPDVPKSIPRYTGSPLIPAAKQTILTLVLAEGVGDLVLLNTCCLTQGLQEVRCGFGRSQDSIRMI